VQRFNTAAQCQQVLQLFWASTLILMWSLYGFFYYLAALMHSSAIAIALHQQPQAFADHHYLCTHTH
jgi:hypothetical protein